MTTAEFVPNFNLQEEIEKEYQKLEHDLELNDDENREAGERFLLLMDRLKPPKDMLYGHTAVTIPKAAEQNWRETWLGNAASRVGETVASAASTIKDLAMEYGVPALEYTVETIIDSGILASKVPPLYSNEGKATAKAVVKAVLNTIKSTGSTTNDTAQLIHDPRLENAIESLLQKETAHNTQSLGKLTPLYEKLEPHAEYLRSHISDDIWQTNFASLDLSKQSNIDLLNLLDMILPHDSRVGQHRLTNIVDKLLEYQKLPKTAQGVEQLLQKLTQRQLSRISNDGNASYHAAQARAHNKNMHSMNGNIDAPASKIDIAEAIATLGKRKPEEERIQIEEVKEQTTDDRVLTGRKEEGQAMSLSDLAIVQGLINALRGEGSYIPGTTPYDIMRNWLVTRPSGSMVVRYSTYNYTFSDYMAALATVSMLTWDVNGNQILETSQIWTKIQLIKGPSIDLMLSSTAANYVEDSVNGNIIANTGLLRTATLPVSGTAIAFLTMLTANRVDASLGGSFASILTKMFLRLQTCVPFFGGERDFSGLWKMMYPANWNNLESGLVLYPATDNVALPNVITDTNQIQAYVCNLYQFTAYLHSQLGTPAVGFEAERWGTEVAVVPVTNSMLNQPGVLSAWSWSYMEYPNTVFSANATIVDSAGLPDTTPPTTAGSWANVANIPKSNTTYIPGPKYKVLFVLIENNALNLLQNNDITFAVGPGANPVALSLVTNNLFGGEAVNLSSATIGGTDEWVGMMEEIAFYTGDLAVSATQYYQNYIIAVQNWIQLFGNKEDWTAATLAAADSSYTLKPGVISHNNVVDYINHDAVRYDKNPQYVNQTTSNNYYPTNTVANAQKYVAKTVYGSTSPLLGQSATGTLTQAPPALVMTDMDVLMMVAVAAKVVQVRNRLTVTETPTQLGAIAGMIKMTARELAYVGDRTMQMLPLPMNELLGGAAPGVNSGSAIVRRFRAKFDDMISGVFKQLGVSVLKTNLIGAPVANTFWNQDGSNNIGDIVAVGCGRLPIYYGYQERSYLPQKTDVIYSRPCGFSILRGNTTAISAALLSEIAPTTTNQNSNWWAPLYTSRQNDILAYNTQPDFYLTPKNGDGGCHLATHQTFSADLDNFSHNVFIWGGGDPSYQQNALFINIPIYTPIPRFSANLLVNAYLKSTGAQALNKFWKGQVFEYNTPVINWTADISNVFIAAGTDNDVLAEFFRF